MEEIIKAAAPTLLDQAPSLNETVNTPKPATTKTNINNVGPRSPTDPVRILDKSEYKEAAACLAEAFADDEVAMYFIDTPDRDHWTPEQKWALHVKILECITYAHCLAGLATTVGPDYGCVSLWLPPGAKLDGWFTTLRSGLLFLPWRASAEGRYRIFKEFFPLLSDTKREILGDRDKECYYLVYVGTKKAARGKGYARKIVEHQTRKADMEGRVTYLESSNIVNVAIYRKLGFEIMRKIYLTRGKKPIELDMMVREPKRIVNGAVE